MKTRPLAWLAAAVSTSIAAALSALPGEAAADYATRNPPMDCARAADKARCEALNQKILACKGKIDDAWRECMHRSEQAASFTPPMPRDCRDARDRPACEAHANALQACTDQPTRAGHRRCVAEHLQAGTRNTKQSR